LAYRLGAAGFDVRLVSSVALARTREALNNSWDKNDPKDAQVILHMMQIGKLSAANYRKNVLLQIFIERPSHL